MSKNIIMSKDAHVRFEPFEQRTSIQPNRFVCKKANVLPNNIDDDRNLQEQMTTNSVVNDSKKSRNIDDQKLQEPNFNHVIFKSVVAVPKNPFHFKPSITSPKTTNIPTSPMRENYANLIIPPFQNKSKLLENKTKQEKEIESNYIDIPTKEIKNDVVENHLQNETTLLKNEALENHLQNETTSQHLILNEEKTKNELLENHVFHFSNETTSLPLILNKEKTKDELLEKKVQNVEKQKWKLVLNELSEFQIWLAEKNEALNIKTELLLEANIKISNLEQENNGLKLQLQDIHSESVPSSHNTSHSELNFSSYGIVFVIGMATWYMVLLC